MKSTTFLIRGGQSRTHASLATSADIFLAVCAFLAIGVLGGALVFAAVEVAKWWAR